MRLRWLVSSILVLAMTSSAMVTFVRPASAAQGLPDEYCYYWTSSYASFDWTEICDTGIKSNVSGDDSWGGPFEIGFDFEFYGNTFSSLYFSTNGLITLDNGSDVLWNPNPLPDPSPPNDYIAPCWTDLCVDLRDFNHGAIFYATLGSSPNRQFVVEWWEISALGSSNRITFEAILSETGDIWFQYLYMDAGSWTGDPTIGIEGPDGSIGCDYDYWNCGFGDLFSIGFARGPVALGPSPTKMADSGTTAFYNLTLMNNQPIEDSFDMVCLSEFGWGLGIYDSLMNLLSDTNGNGIQDTGNVPAWGKVDLVFSTEVQSPLDYYVYGDVTTVYATSFTNPAISDTAVITTLTTPMSLAPPHSDFLVDSDGDGANDSLEVDVNVDVSVIGPLYMAGTLSDGLGNPIATSTSMGTLSKGNQTVSLLFAGWKIYDNGVDGPYNVSLALGIAYGSTGYTMFETGSYTTAAYAYTDFSPAPIAFVPPHMDIGVDSDSDLLNESILLQVNVDVRIADSYAIEAVLMDMGQTSVIATAQASAYLGVGLQTIELQFMSGDVWNSGIDGSYQVLLRAYAYYYSMTLIAVDDHITQTYSRSELKPPDAWFAPPHNDRGLDTNGDGLYDYLIVEARVEVLVPGTFTVYASLTDSWDSEISSQSNTSYLDAGLQTVELCYSGQAIRSSFYWSSPCWARMLIADGDWVIIGESSHELVGYSWEDLQGPPAAFAPPQRDSGLDIDGNGLWDFLVANVSLNVSSAGDFRVTATLYSSDWLQLDQVAVDLSLTPGLRSFDVMFAGWMISIQGVDGPYNMVFDLVESSRGLIERARHYAPGYSANEFDSLTPGIRSAFDSDTPTVDGVFEPGEWAGAATLNLTEEDSSNELATLVLLKNNLTDLFVCYDVVGDLTDDISDYASISFDTDGDDLLTDGHDDQFIQDGGYYLGGSHWILSIADNGWIVDCLPFDQLKDNHTGLFAGMAFGISNNSPVSHRIFEFSIPLALLGVQPGDVLGMLVGASGAAGVMDSDPWISSCWPKYFLSMPPLSMFGRLRIGTPPMICNATLSGTEGLDGWYVSPVTVGLNASGGVGGPYRTMYRVDGSGWMNYTSPFVVTSNGFHALDFYSIDRKNISTEVQTFGFKVDTSAPLSQVLLPVANGLAGWYHGVVDGYISGVDPVSGILSTNYRIDGGAWLNNTHFMLSTDGNHTIEYYCSDNAGNLEEIASVVVRIDSVPPTDITVSVRPDVQITGYYTSTVTFNIDKVLDDASGFNHSYYKINNGSWVAYTDTVELTVDGEYQLDYYADDAAGNSMTPRTMVIAIDCTAPAVVVGAKTVFDSGDVTLEWNCSDNFSGLHQIDVSLDGAPFVRIGTNVSVEYRGLGSGNHSLVIRAVDNAGNVGEATYLFSVKEKPGGIATILIVAGLSILALISISTLIIRRRR